jgi:hypothetical protein
MPGVGQLAGQIDGLVSGDRSGDSEDDVHGLRDTYCADVVVLLEETNFTGGVGWLLNTE